MFDGKSRENASNSRPGFSFRTIFIAGASLIIFWGLYYLVVFSWMHLSYPGYVKSCRVFTYYWPVFSVAVTILLALSITAPHPTNKKARIILFTSVAVMLLTMGTLQLRKVFFKSLYSENWMKIYYDFIVVMVASLIFLSAIRLMSRLNPARSFIRIVTAYLLFFGFFGAWYLSVNRGWWSLDIFSYLNSRTGQQIPGPEFPPIIYGGCVIPFRATPSAWRFMEWCNSPIRFMDFFFLSIGLLSMASKFVCGKKGGQTGETTTSNSSQ